MLCRAASWRDATVNGGGNTAAGIGGAWFSAFSFLLQVNMESSTCLELALEGERLCKAGDFHSGVEYLSAAINVGTDDSRVLSAVYSQLGNASFYLGDYNKALQYHLLDLNTAK